jgi:hypothetical protein
MRKHLSEFLTKPQPLEPNIRISHSTIIIHKVEHTIYYLVKLYSTRKLSVSGLKSLIYKDGNIIADIYSQFLITLHLYTFHTCARTNSDTF